MRTDDRVANRSGEETGQLRTSVKVPSRLCLQAILQTIVTKVEALPWSAEDDSFKDSGVAQEPREAPQMFSSAWLWHETGRVSHSFCVCSPSNISLLQSTSPMFVGSAFPHSQLRGFG